MPTPDPDLRDIEYAASCLEDSKVALVIKSLTEYIAILEDRIIELETRNR